MFTHCLKRLNRAFCRADNSAPHLIMPPRLTRDRKPTQPRIWWANAVFFILVHFGALVGMYYFPPWATSRATLLLWFTTWQLSDFGCVDTLTLNMPRVDVPSSQDYHWLPSTVFSQGVPGYNRRSYCFGCLGLLCFSRFYQGWGIISQLRLLILNPI